MRKNFGTKSWFYPLPVLVIGTYDENGNPDAMNGRMGRPVRCRQGSTVSER